MTTTPITTIDPIALAARVAELLADAALTTRVRSALAQVRAELLAQRGRERNR